MSGRARLLCLLAWIGLITGCAGYRELELNLMSLSDENLPGKEVRVTMPDGQQQDVVVRRIEWPRLLGNNGQKDVAIDLSRVEKVEIEKQSWFDTAEMGANSVATVGVVALLVIGSLIIAL